MNLLIVGAGGHGRAVYETAVLTGAFQKISFLDDRALNAIGTCEQYKEFSEEYSCAIVAIGRNNLRQEWMQKLRMVGYEIPVLVHPDSYISKSAQIGEGTVVLSKAVVHTGSKIGPGCILSIGSLIDHDVIIEECCHINAGAVVKAGSFVRELTKVDAGLVYTNAKES